MADARSVAETVELEAYLSNPENERPVEEPASRCTNAASMSSSSSTQRGAAEASASAKESSVRAALFREAM